MNINESLPSAVSRPCIADHRAEGVAVGLLVGGEDEAPVLADPLEHQLACAVAVRRCAHALWPSPRSSLDAEGALGGVVVDELERGRALQAQLGGDPAL